MDIVLERFSAFYSPALYIPDMLQSTVFKSLELLFL